MIISIQACFLKAVLSVEKTAAQLLARRASLSVQKRPVAFFPAGLLLSDFASNESFIVDDGEDGIDFLNKMAFFSKNVDASSVQDKALLDQLKTIVKRYVKKYDSPYVRQVVRNLFGVKSDIVFSITESKDENISLTVDFLNNLIRQSVEESRYDLLLYKELEYLEKESKKIPNSYTYRLLKKVPYFNVNQYYSSYLAEESSVVKIIKKISQDPSFKFIVNQVDSKGQTPLTALFSFGSRALNQSAIISILANAGADSTLKDSLGDSPVRLVIQKVVDNTMLPNQGARLLELAGANMMQEFDDVKMPSGLKTANLLEILSIKQGSWDKILSSYFGGSSNFERFLFLKDRATEGVVYVGNYLERVILNTPVATLKSLYEKLADMSKSSFKRQQMVWNPIVRRVFKLAGKELEVSFDANQQMSKKQALFQKSFDVENVLSDKAKEVAKAQAKKFSIKKNRYDNSVEQLMLQQETGFLD